MAGRTLAHGWHLARRFVGALSAAPPPADDEAWARSHLLAGEVALWERASNPDRRHAVAVARAVVDRLGPDASRPVVAAALLHDVGKVVSGLGTFARVGATLVWAVAPPTAAPRWATRDGVVRRLGQYRLHPELGAELLAEAGADPLTVAWAREHHRPAHRWSLPPHLAAALKDCDDD